MEKMKRGPREKGWLFKRHPYPNVTISGGTIKWVSSISNDYNISISRITEAALIDYLSKNYPLEKKK